MSDNPADSLRRELDERQLGWLVGAAINKWQRGGPLTISEYVARDLWPTLRAWVEAARAGDSCPHGVAHWTRCADCKAAAEAS